MKIPWKISGLIGLILFLSCRDRPEYSVATELVRASQLTVCDQRSCPEVLLNYPRFTARDSTLSQVLNRLTDSLILTELYLGSDQADLSLSLNQALTQYLWLALDYRTELQAENAYHTTLSLETRRENDSILSLIMTGEMRLPAQNKNLTKTLTFNLLTYHLMGP